MRWPRWLRRRFKRCKVTTTRVYATENVGEYITSTDVVYATAAEGSGTITVLPAGTTTLVVGQQITTPYIIYESFLQFDVSGLRGRMVSSATLSLNLSADVSTTDFTVQARTHDWGAALAAGDFVAGSGLAAKTLLATLDTNGIGAADLEKSFTNNSTNLRDAIQAAIEGSGVVYIILVSSLHVAATPPTTNERVLFKATQDGNDRDPKLTIVHEEAFAGSVKNLRPIPVKAH